MDTHKNVTLRRANTNLNFTDETDMSVDLSDVTSNSLPDVNIDQNEQIKNLQLEIKEIQIQLSSAHSEVEQLLLENKNLQRQNKELQKKNDFYRKVGSSPSNKSSPMTQKRMNNSQSKPKIHNQTQTYSEKLSDNITKQKNQVTQTDEKAIGLIEGYDKETQTNKERQIKVLDNVTQTDIEIETNSTETQTIWEGENELLGKVRRTGSMENTKHILDNTVQTKQTRKICILSTNSHNKILAIAENTLTYSEVCHYLKPKNKTRELLMEIDAKLENFTLNDYCIIMIGEEDFKTTTDYFETTKVIRETLQQLKHTNIIICLPTYKYGKALDVYNWRIETFNNLLYLDVSTHEYAYIIDSNEVLKYDYSMFNRFTGKINNYGLKLIFGKIECYVNDLHSYNMALQSQDQWFFRD